MRKAEPWVHLKDVPNSHRTTARCSTTVHTLLRSLHTWLRTTTSWNRILQKVVSTCCSLSCGLLAHQCEARGRSSCMPCTVLQLPSLYTICTWNSLRGWSQAQTCSKAWSHSVCFSVGVCQCVRSCESRKQHLTVSSSQVTVSVVLRFIFEVSLLESEDGVFSYFVSFTQRQKHCTSPFLFLFSLPRIEIRKEIRFRGILVFFSVPPGKCSDND